MIDDPQIVKCQAGLSSGEVMALVDVGLGKQKPHADQGDEDAEHQPSRSRQVA